MQRTEKHWGSKMQANEKNMFDRMMGRSFIRGTLPTQRHPDRSPKKWTGITVKCPSEITGDVLDALYTSRVNQGAALSLAKQEIEFVRRLVKCLIRADKRAPALDTITVKMVYPDNARKRIPLASEIHALCSQMPEHHSDYVYCLALSGSRSQEMAAARYSSIVWVNGEMQSIWLEDTKNGGKYEKMFRDENGNMLDFGEIIERRYAARIRTSDNTDHDWIFPMPKDATRHRDHSLEYWYRAMKKTNINSKEVCGLVVNNGEALSPHHLRHFVGASLAAKGYSTAIIKKQLNQRDDRSAQIYIDRVANTHAHETASVMNNIMNDAKGQEGTA